ncbi:PDZ domain-containing protein [Isoptericola sp. b441]|uniref:PDZ domain-containing protein n=1 Tax=Actinotalea lenta TaxID=3064654 RepID=A0ABT9DD89_9CELL|nr:MULTISPECIES: PDZ domain-containing protein [unclassified Isoptericola]MDO8108309.1 PDZ domain-containing protein [Isoptericola sp. b441]MDO8122678.1 PDZ domain-containing protein [Isoptericola sp. b490]
MSDDPRTPAPDATPHGEPDVAEGGDPFVPSDDEGQDEPRPATPRSITLSVSVVALALLLAVASALPLPYAVEAPGPTLNTLGAHDGKPLIEIPHAKTYPVTGQLRLVTVSTAGGPGYPVTLGRMLSGWASRQDSVIPVEAIFPPDQTQKQISQAGQQEMISSQEDATVSALEELGYQVPTTLTVGDVMTGSGADGHVRKGDVITAVNGVQVDSFSALSTQMDAVRPGDTVTLTVTRDGSPTQVPVTTTDDGHGRALLGVLIDPSFDFPVDVSIQIENIGGPSAGTMFALGIIDLLTPEDMADGQVIAGTGTMDLTGTVGPIGGIRQKMYGARHDGATWFLAPAQNCAEVVGHVPDGLHVVSVTTLHGARQAVEAIGAGKGDQLPTCS